MMPVGSRAALTACRVFRPTGPTSSWSPADMVAADAVMMAEGASGGQDGLVAASFTAHHCSISAPGT